MQDLAIMLLLQFYLLCSCAFDAWYLYCAFSFSKPQGSDSVNYILQVANCCVTAAILMANMLTDAVGLVMEISQGEVLCFLTKDNEIDI